MMIQWADNIFSDDEDFITSIPSLKIWKVKNCHSNNSLKMHLKINSTKSKIKNRYINTFDSSKCFICCKRNFLNNIYNHLVFGSVSCNNCIWSAETCDQFSRIHICRIGCQHTSLTWSFDKIDDTLTDTNDTTRQEDVLRFFKSYLTKSQALMNYGHYSVGYKYFNLSMVHYDEKYFTNRLFETETTKTITEDTNNNPQNYISPELINPKQSFQEAIDEDGSSLKKRKNVSKRHSSTSFKIKSKTKHSKTRKDSKDKSHHKIDLSMVHYDKKYFTNRLFETETTKTITEDTNNNPQNYISPELINPKRSFQETNDEDGSSLKKRKNDSKRHSSTSFEIKSNTKHSKTRKDAKDKSHHKIDLNLIPAYARENCVVTYRFLEDCPQCWEQFSSNSLLGINIHTAMVTLNCKKCSIYICVDISGVTKKKEAKGRTWK